jgi:anthranilate phosphoribosyltransferase
MIRQATAKLTQENLSAAETEVVMKEIMSGSVTTPEIVAFLRALNNQGITAEELVGAARVMCEEMLKVQSQQQVILDTCGTGGDKKYTFNISTAAALVASGTGITVAKHGNRSVSSKCGSADVLEALGVNINMSRETAQSCLEEVGISFLFAPNFHPAMKYAREARREIGEKTIFNFLGPLCNPAHANHQLIGVASSDWAEKMAGALAKLNMVHAMVVHGHDHMDEISIRTKTSCWEVHAGKVSPEKEIDSREFGFTSRIGEVTGGTAEENARILMRVLNREPGPYRDIVLLNAGAAIYVADKAASLQEGIALARQSIDSGSALKKLELLKECSNY